MFLECRGQVALVARRAGELHLWHTKEAVAAQANCIAHEGCAALAARRAGDKHSKLDSHTS